MQSPALPDKQSAHRRLLKIGEVARRSGVGIEALRFYERRGILESPVRTESGYRVYHEAVLRQLDFIKQAQALGFSLDEVKRIIDDARAGISPCDEVREIIRHRLRDLDAQLRELRRYRTELARTLAVWDRVGQAPGYICGFIENAQIRQGYKTTTLKNGRQGHATDQPEGRA